MAPRDGKHLTFILADEEYAIPVTDVREIVGPLPVTPVPGTAHHVLGVINLRGKVIPVIDLRVRLGLMAGEIGPRSCVVVCQSSTATLVGALVDSVNEVMSLRPEDAEAAPAAAGAEVAGLAKVKGRVVILLDVAAAVGDIAAAA
ncbi:MAG: purine-binding chemotaxis protein CheW [Kofleriaceae bacterium]|jgi:purine-binding chemotaxis protein CheW|nr:purine-binding chemotaxis protein CheW [Kofleriaceae bacterium]MBP9167501.1 purine-binding chemotaxis protein CheW [Kofleriaceae bacterium]MBP9856582.1 purine-binding chemotaxis protein CheW [Kofleriaceae bacterium]